MPSLQGIAESLFVSPAPRFSNVSSIFPSTFRERDVAVKGLVHSYPCFGLQYLLFLSSYTFFFSVIPR